MERKKAQEIYHKLSLLHKGAACELNFQSPFELMVAVILSAQCTDKRVNIITEKLFKVYNTPEQFSALTLQELKPYIFSCGFYNNKGNSIINMSKAVMDKHNGNIPKSFEELVALKGVGRKTANVILAEAYRIPAMPVDTHVFRVAKRLNLSKSDKPEGVEKDLCRIIDKDKWYNLHHYLIHHGRYICHSRNPECAICTLKENCKFYKKNISNKDNKRLGEEEK